MRYFLYARMQLCLTILAGLIFVLSFLGAPVYGQAGSKCLWSISASNNTVYLLGSIHLLSRWDYPLDEAFEQAYRDSTVIVFETDLAEMDQPETRALMARHSLLPRERTIRDVLTNRTFQMLVRHLDNEGLDMVRFEGLRPWVCALNLTMLELSQRGYSPAFGIDRYFYQHARQDRKTIIPLESVAEQLSLFFELDKAEQDAFLQRTLTDLGRVETLFPKMLALWKSGDLARLDEIMQASFAAHPALYDRFLVRRNRQWMPVIESLVGRSENALVIVGASHLGGAQGVITQLRRKGYTVVQK